MLTSRASARVVLGRPGRAVVRLFALALASACGAAPSEPGGRAGSDGAEERGAGGDSVGRASCAGACAMGETCERPDGWRCSCQHHPDTVCGGAPREPGPAVWAWSCAPADPRADRGDGCPFAEPGQGEPCTAPASCRYERDACGWSGLDASCLGGRWHLEPYHLPPPP